ncbi:MAG: Ig-like domain-containing protein [Oscillospiraceae bacterium]|nr:Ig-like domain-containing protein [Oscillospiraceae bacterium]
MLGKIRAVVGGAFALVIVLSLWTFTASAQPRLSRTSGTIVVNQVASLSVSGAGNQTIRWSSDNTSVVQVNSQGRIKGFKAGTANIRATVGSTVLTCRITVIDGRITPGVTRLNMAVGETQRVNLNVFLSPRTIAAVSTDRDVATISWVGAQWDGNNIPIAINARGNGTAKIKVYARNHPNTVFCDIEVRVGTGNSNVVIVSPTDNVSVRAGQTETLRLSTSRANAVSVSSLNTRVATVSLGTSSGTTTNVNVRGVSAGTTTLRITDRNNSRNITDVRITVTAEEDVIIIPPTESVSVRAGQTETLRLYTSRANAVNISSLNTNVATVTLGTSSGTNTNVNIRGVTAGTTTLRITDKNNSRNVTDVRVTVTADDVIIIPPTESVSVRAGQTETLRLYTSRANAVNVSSLNTNVATVTLGTSSGTNTNVNIRGVTAGTTTLRITDKSNSRNVKDVRITVTSDDVIIISPTESVSVKAGQTETLRLYTSRANAVDVSSQNTNIATVTLGTSSGTVTNVNIRGVAKGNTTLRITDRSNSRNVTTVRITVTDSDVVIISPLSEVRTETGKTEVLRIHTSRTNSVNVSSFNTGIATVSLGTSSGTITNINVRGVSAGTTTLRITDKNNSANFVDVRVVVSTSYTLYGLMTTSPSGVQSGHITLSWTGLSGAANYMVVPADIWENTIFDNDNALRYDAYYDTLYSSKKQGTNAREVTVSASTGAKPRTAYMYLSNQNLVGDANLAKVLENAVKGTGNKVSMPVAVNN